MQAEWPHRDWGQGKCWTFESLAEAEEAGLYTWDELHVQWPRACQGAGRISGNTIRLTCALQFGAEWHSKLTRDAGLPSLLRMMQRRIPEGPLRGGLMSQFGAAGQYSDIVGKEGFNQMTHWGHL